jgi:hypothetical protein
MRGSASGYVPVSNYQGIRNTAFNKIFNLSAFHVVRGGGRPRPRLVAAYSRKLHKSMYDGGDNGGLTYGVEIMNEHRKGTRAGVH